MNALKTLLLAFSLLVVSQAKAGFITINESALDGIFSQPSFGNSPIDIRIGTATELVFPDLLDITTRDEVIKLFNQHVGPFNLINFYFIDFISACGFDINKYFVGCGQVNGNNFVVESDFASGSSGTELLAHELGHNLGLFHLTDTIGLMSPSLNNNTSLSSNEVSAILRSQFVQGDIQSGFFININPVLIVATASTPVPEPSTLLLLLLSISFLVRKNHKKLSYNI